MLRCRERKIYFPRYRDRGPLVHSRAYILPLSEPCPIKIAVILRAADCEDGDFLTVDFRAEAVTETVDFTEVSCRDHVRKYE